MYTHLCKKNYIYMNKIEGGSWRKLERGIKRVTYKKGRVKFCFCCLQYIHLYTRKIYVRISIRTICININHRGKNREFLGERKIKWENE